MKIIRTLDDLEHTRRQGEVSSALIEAVRQDLALAAEIDPPDDMDEGLCGCRFVILEEPADAAREGLTEDSIASFEFAEAYVVDGVRVHRTAVMSDNHCFSLYYSVAGTLGPDIETRLQEHVTC